MSYKFCVVNTTILLTIENGRLTIGNIMLLLVIDNKCVIAGLLTFVNSARIFPGKISGIKNPPAGRGDKTNLNWRCVV